MTTTVEIRQKRISQRDLYTDLAKVAREVRSGDTSYLVTYQHRPAFKIVPIQTTPKKKRYTLADFMNLAGTITKENDRCPEMNSQNYRDFIISK